MKSKTTWLTFLICLNLALLTGFGLAAYTPRAAHAQGAGLGSNYLVVTGEIQNDFDALYLLDLSERTLHSFYFHRGSNNLEYGGYRMLERDFRHSRQ